MKVIHINSSDINGGAARSAYRIHRSIVEHGDKFNIKSTMRVINKESDDFTVIGKTPIGKNKYYINLLPYLAKITRIGFVPNNLSIHSNAPFPSGLGRELRERYKNDSEEIVHLHWLGDNTLSINELGSIKQKIVWTLHDQWAFLGAEHYTINKRLGISIDSNQRFINGYKKENRLEGEKGRDINLFTFNRKLRNWKNKIHIVCPSKWMANCAKNSFLMKNFNISIIPYPIDLKRWSPINKKEARNILNLPNNKKYILFGAIGGTTDFRKGYDLLLKAIKKLNFKLDSSYSNNIELLIFGQSRPYSKLNLPFPIHYFGYLHDDISLRVLYSAADLLVVPSRLDNLPNTGIESHACGTPVVAFKVGGLEDIVEDNVTGSLAKPFDIDSLVNSIKWVLENSYNLNLGQKARNRAENLWDPLKITTLYSRIYESGI